MSSSKVNRYGKEGSVSVTFRLVSCFLFFQASYNVWVRGECKGAPNGGVMRTSILGIHNHHDIDRVIQNTIAMCRVTHADPR